MKNIAYEIAWHYLRSSYKEKNSALMMIICFIGIAIGTCALMLTLIITSGFEKTIHEKMQGINAHLIMRSRGEAIDINLLRNAINEHYSNDIEAIAGNNVHEILIEKNNKQHIVVLKGIEPEFEEKVSNIKSKIISSLENSKSFPYLLAKNHIIMGYKIARACNVRIGDTLSILIPEIGIKNKINLVKKKVIVAGLVKIGLEEYDNGFAFCNIQLFNQMFDKEGVENVSVKLYSKDSFKDKLHPTSHEKQLIERLEETFPTLEILSWKDLYPALVSSLTLEKYVMFIIIALITLVASMNMISLLFIHIQQKRKDIAILRTMGLAQRSIKKIFLTVGLFITTSASCLGLAIAGIIGIVLEKNPFIELPDVYYVSYLPARVEPELFAIVFICTFVIGLISVLIPLKQISRINIIDILRME